LTLPQAMETAGAKILEPVMKVEVSGPEEYAPCHLHPCTFRAFNHAARCRYQGVLVASINRRKGVIKDTSSDKGFVTVTCEVALSNMFGYSTDLRSSTQVRVRPLARCSQCIAVAAPRFLRVSLPL